MWLMQGCISRLQGMLCLFLDYWLIKHSGIVPFWFLVYCSLVCTVRGLSLLKVYLFVGWISQLQGMHCLSLAGWGYSSFSYLLFALRVWVTQPCESRYGCLQLRRRCIWTGDNSFAALLIYWWGVLFSGVVKVALFVCFAIWSDAANHSRRRWIDPKWVHVCAGSRRPLTFSYLAPETKRLPEYKFSGILIYMF